jgi:curved DNA-binding protein
MITGDLRIGIDPAAARDLLGVAPDVGPEALRHAFNRAVKAAHPDRPGGDAERLRAVVEAYRSLASAPPRAPVTASSDDATARLEISVTEALVGGWVRLASDVGPAWSVRLPAGLRAGEQVRVWGRTFQVSISGEDDMAVVGDDLLVTASIPRAVARVGGRVRIETPIDAVILWVSRADVARGFVRLAGLGLPARGEHPAGDVLARLKPAADEGLDTSAQTKRRRFAAAWAA